MKTQPPYIHWNLRTVLSRQEEQSLPAFIRWSWIILGFASLFQVVLFGSLDNSIATGAVILAWLLLCRAVLSYKNINTYPLSSFILIGYVSTQFYFPLIFTLLEGKPLIFNLELPLRVFFHSFAALLILILAHVLYRGLVEQFSTRRVSTLEKYKFFTPPSALQLWLMGFIGLAATFYVYLYALTATKTVGTATDKFIEALVPFSYAPYFIPFTKLYGEAKPLSKRTALLLTAYTIAIFAISIARNSRGTFMIGFASLAFAYALGLLLGYYKARFFTLRYLFIALTSFWLFTGPVADIGTAMVLVRQQRNDIPYSELVSLTLEAFHDKESIRLYRMAESSEKQDWDEHYLNNIFIARFSNLKYNDTSLLLSSKISEYDPDVFDFTINHFLANLPSPVLNLLGVNFDKRSVNQVSFGDYLFSKVYAKPQALGSFFTGHFAGTGMAAFGWWYLAILGVGIIPVYFLYDKLTIQTRALHQPTAAFHTKLRFSFCGLLFLTPIFQFFPAESVEKIGAFLLRGWLQMIILYFVLYHLTYFLDKALTGFAPSRRVKPQSQPIY
ncbi:hypothetical protein [Hymenobacter qilianensis]|uniref:O-antigen polysaccharide polymerase Wzy n=2 Tax=Hymenobacter qilianensis TaxID=1385715 RepID=A0A7H0GSD1_9BACT|nr:hypothetical protein [Hymenobacter qilianensis]QNP51197.1 hypothetical protein H9L05_14005 [Hymenobacter qilianensis]